MEESLQRILTFLGGIWIAWTAIIKAAEFVNDLRDSVVMGTKGASSLTVAHREAMRVDWLLTMFTAITVPIVLTSLLLAIAVDTGFGFPLGWVFIAVALAPALGASLFTACGISDWRLMSDALALARATTMKDTSNEPTGPNVSSSSGPLTAAT